VSKKRRKRGSIGRTIGGIVVGFDQQIFRTTPPVQELVAKGQPVRGVSGQDPGLTVVFPEDVVEDDPRPIADPNPISDPNPIADPSPAVADAGAPASPAANDREG
jgi:hypothetical protein